MEGDRTMLKLLLELHMSKSTQTDPMAKSDKVTINISGPSASPNGTDKAEINTEISQNES
jgi:hypothetical protein